MEYRKRVDKNKGFLQRQDDFSYFCRLKLIFAAVGGRNLADLLGSSKTALYEIVCIRVREIRIVEDPHLSDPSWEGVGGQQIAMCAGRYAQRDMRREICAV